jgi:hypothetical protein
MREWTGFIEVGMRVSLRGGDEGTIGLIKFMPSVGTRFQLTCMLGWYSRKHIQPDDTAALHVKPRRRKKPAFAQISAFGEFFQEVRQPP